MICQIVSSFWGTQFFLIQFVKYAARVVPYGCVLDGTHLQKRSYIRKFSKHFAGGEEGSHLSSQRHPGTPDLGDRLSSWLSGLLGLPLHFGGAVHLPEDLRRLSAGQNPSVFSRDRRPLVLRQAEAVRAR